MSTGIDGATLGYVVKISSDLIIHDSDVMSDLETIGSDLVIVMSDVKVAISDIDAIVISSAKENALMGLAINPINENFQDVADNADPNAATWTVVEGVTGTVEVEHTAASPNHSICKLTTVANADDAFIETFTNNVFFTIKDDDDMGELHFKAEVYADNLGHGVIGFGLMGFVDGVISNPRDFEGATNNLDQVGFYLDGTNEEFWTATQAADESTDVSASWTDSTWHEVEIVIKAAAVTLYIDGTLRATHTTQIPNNTWYPAFAVRQTTAATTMRISYVRIWNQ